MKNDKIGTMPNLLIYYGKDVNSLLIFVLTKTVLILDVELVPLWISLLKKQPDSRGHFRFESLICNVSIELRMWTTSSYQNSFAAVFFASNLSFGYKIL